MGSGCAWFFVGLFTILSIISGLFLGPFNCLGSANKTCFGKAVVAELDTMTILVNNTDNTNSNVCTIGLTLEDDGVAVSQVNCDQCTLDMEIVGNTIVLKRVLCIDVKCWLVFNRDNVEIIVERNNCDDLLVGDEYGLYEETDGTYQLAYDMEKFETLINDIRLSFGVITGAMIGLWLVALCCGLSYHWC